MVHVSRLHTFSGHRDSIYSLASLPDTSQFFSCAGDGMIVQWDIEKPDEGKLVARMDHSVYAILYHEPTNTLLAGHNYEGIHILDWQNAREVSSLKLGSAAIFDIQIAQDLLIVASGDGAVTLIDLKTLRIKQTLKRSDKSARSIAVNLQTGEFAVGYSDHFIRVFDLQDLSLKHEWRGHTNSVFTVRYSPDNDFLLSGSRDAHLRVWDVRARYTQAAQIVAHMYAINHLDFSPDGKHFVTCSMDKSIKVWDYESLRLLKVIDKARHAGHGTSVNRLLWMSHQHQLLSASDDRTISAWNVSFV